MRLFRKLDFKNLLTRFPGQAWGGLQEPEIRVIEEFQEAEEIFARAAGAEEAGVALLTEGEICGIAISLSDKENYYIPAGGFLSGAYLKGAAEKVMDGCGEVCAFDLKELLKYVQPERRERFFDVRIGAYLLNPLKSSYTYDDIAKEFAGITLPSGEEIFGNAKIPGRLRHGPRGRGTLLRSDRLGFQGVQSPHDGEAERAGDGKIVPGDGDAPGIYAGRYGEGGNRCGGRGAPGIRREAEPGD